jgi:tRNA G18 (ribose-2'-O)-methylase SpoU
MAKVLQVTAVTRAEVAVSAASVLVAAMKPQFPAVVVLGSERCGVSPEVLALADQAVAVPMLGMGNSLNVTTATVGRVAR